MESANTGLSKGNSRKESQAHGPLVEYVKISVCPGVLELEKGASDSGEASAYKLKHSINSLAPVRKGTCQLTKETLAFPVP